MANYNYLPHSDLLELRRWNTPTIYNGWEAVTRRDRLECNCSWEGGLIDLTPQMGPMVGYAVTVTYKCGDVAYKNAHPNCYADLYAYLAKIPGPKILFAKDLEYPHSYGSIFGEVTGNAYRALGCVGCITDGTARDVDEASYGGIKMMARGLRVGHAYSCPVEFGVDVEMYGTTIKPGMLVHADKYGFIAIPENETKYLAEAARFCDTIECQTTIVAGREREGLSQEEVCRRLQAATEEYSRRNAAFIAEIQRRYAEEEQ